MNADVCPEPPLNLSAPGAPEGLCRLSSRLEGGESIFSGHSDSRLNVRQTASRRRSQHRRSCGLLVRKPTNGQPVVVTKGQVPPDEPTAYALEEFGNGFLTIFWLSQPVDRSCAGKRSTAPRRGAAHRVLIDRAIRLSKAPRAWHPVVRCNASGCRPIVRGSSHTWRTFRRRQSGGLPHFYLTALWISRFHRPRSVVYTAIAGTIQFSRRVSALALRMPIASLI